MISIALREVLASASQELNPSRYWPLPIRPIVERLGIKLNFEPTAADRRTAHLIIDDPPVITIYRHNENARDLDNNERFSLAHELGHWIVWRRTRIAPRPGANYWEHEVLCNEFAAELLVPKIRLRDYIGELREQGIKSVFFPSIVSQSAEVSWSVAARAITALNPRLGYLRMAVNSHGRLFVRRSSVSCSPGSYLGERSYIDDESLRAITRELKPGTKKTIRVSFVAGALEVIDTPCIILRELRHDVCSFVLAFAVVPPAPSSSSLTGFVLAPEVNDPSRLKTSWSEQQAG